MTNKHSTATFDALVTLARSLRPDWTTEGIRNAIRLTLGQPEMPPLCDLTYALVRIAIDPTIETPAILPKPGPHWRQPSEVDRRPTPRPPRRDESCPDHPGQWRNGCHACAADLLTEETA